MDLKFQGLEQSSSSNSSDSNEEGEVEPSEDELTNVKFSESDTLIRTPNPGPPVDEPRGNPKSGPTNYTKNDPKCSDITLFTKMVKTHKSNKSTQIWSINTSKQLHQPTHNSTSSDNQISSPKLLISENFGLKSRVL